VVTPNKRASAAFVMAAQIIRSQADRRTPRTAPALARSSSGWSPSAGKVVCASRWAHFSQTTAVSFRVTKEGRGRTMGGRADLWDLLIQTAGLTLDLIDGLADPAHVAWVLVWAEELADYPPRRAGLRLWKRL